MEIIKRLLKSRKIFYLLFSVFCILAFLFLLNVFFGSTPAISCSSSPGPFQPGTNWYYKISHYYINPVADILGLIILLLGFVLFTLGLFQKGIPRTISIIIITTLIIWIILSWLLHGDTLKPAAQDAQRRNVLAGISIELANYYSENKRYPGSPGSNQFYILGEALEWKFFEYMARTTPDFSLPPNDPCYKENSEWAYEYWVSSDGQKYVLKANFQTPFLPSDDLDGNILGASCGKDGPQEREYCISPHF